MKRMLVAGAIAALALIGTAGAASAAPADAACFGGIHKAVNTEGRRARQRRPAREGLGGQGKNAAAGSQR